MPLLHLLQHIAAQVGERFDDRMAAVDDLERARLDERGANVTAFGRNLRERTGDVELGE